MKYALIITADTRLLPSVNAMINAIKYYNYRNYHTSRGEPRNDYRLPPVQDGGFDVHFLYWPSKPDSPMSRFVEQAKKTFSNFYPVSLLDLVTPEYERMKPVYYLKFYRSYYASTLTEYDVVAYMDADRYICSNLMPYFELANDTQEIMMCDYRFRQSNVDSGFYDKYPIQGTNGCPYDPSATFFNPRKWGKYYAQIRDLGRDVVKKGEMPTVNYMVIKNELYPHIIRLPALLWNMRKLHQCRLTWEREADRYERAESIRREKYTKAGIDVSWSLRSLTPTDLKYNLFIDSREDWTDRIFYNGKDISDSLSIKTEWVSGMSLMHPPDISTDKVIAVHGRYYYRATLTGKVASNDQISRKPSLVHQNHNMAQYLAMMKFFSFEQGNRLEDWSDSYFGENDYVDLEKNEYVVGE